MMACCLFWFLREGGERRRSGDYGAGGPTVDAALQIIVLRNFTALIGSTK
jgi:hypothetical protein